MKNVLEISDFHAAITLITLGFRLPSINKSNPKRYIFEFENSPDIQSALEEFFRGELRLDPRLVLLNAKLLNDRMHERI